MKAFTVSCAEHGPMERDEPRMGYVCVARASCPRWLPDEEVHRLVSGVPADAPDPVPIVVT
jgi:hypothetical protein